MSGASLSSCTSSGTNIIDNSVTYDEIGDILTKSDVGTYTYPSAGSAQPHGVAGINTTTGCTLASCTVAGASNPIYEYDANGNVTCASVGAACTGTKIRQITYSAANMTTKAKEGTAYTYSFTYNPEHERSEMSDQSGDQTYYLNDPASNVMNERYSSGGVVTWRSYIVADGKIVELHSVTGSTTTMQYFVLDHLGSVATIYIPSQTSNPIVNQSYDAWGKMRNPTTGLGDQSCALPPASPTTRGFTNQEQMTQQCLDNYNARIYDPQIGRFMAADTVIPDSYNGQSYNRYTYVENGPLSYDDPTGHGMGYMPPSSLADIEGGVNEWPHGGLSEIDDSGILPHSQQPGSSSAQGSSPAGPTENAPISNPGNGGNNNPDMGTSPLPPNEVYAEVDANSPLSKTPDELQALLEALDNDAAPLDDNIQSSSKRIDPSDNSGTDTDQNSNATDPQPEHDKDAKPDNANGQNPPGSTRVAEVAEEEEEGRPEETPEERALEEWRRGIDNRPLPDPNTDYPKLTPQQQKEMDDLIQRLEDIGGGAPRVVPSPKGAPQFIFPNGTVLRFDLQPGQYLRGQGPHINLQNVPEAPNQNEHIPVKPNS